MRQLFVSAKHVLAPRSLPPSEALPANSQHPKVAMKSSQLEEFTVAVARGSDEANESKLWYHLPAGQPGGSDRQHCPPPVCLCARCRPAHLGVPYHTWLHPPCQVSTVFSWRQDLYKVIVCLREPLNGDHLSGFFRVSEAQKKLRATQSTGERSSGEKPDPAARCSASCPADGLWGVVLTPSIHTMP